MKSRLAACLLLLCTTIPVAYAETLRCPDLASAVQVGACPGEQELAYTFTGYCSDNARMYRGDNDVCTDYARYRKLKNIALWESADGLFQSYVSCDLPQAGVRQAKALTIAVAKQGKITRVLCGYGEAGTFSYRTRAQCRVVGDGNCGADPASCTASCD